MAEMHQSEKLSLVILWILVSTRPKKTQKTGQLVPRHTRSSCYCGENDAVPHGLPTYTLAVACVEQHYPPGGTNAKKYAVCSFLNNVNLTFVLNLQQQWPGVSAGVIDG